MNLQQSHPSSGSFGGWMIPAPPTSVVEQAVPPQSGPLDLQKWLSVFRRRASLFLTLAIAIFGCFVVGTLAAPREYTAAAEVVVDARHQNMVDAAPVVQDLPRSNTEANIVDTQVAILRSRALAAKVAQELQLVDDPEFNGTLTEPTGPRAWLRSFFPQPEPTAAEVRQSVVDVLLGKLSIRREGLTYVIEIAITSSDPEKSARIANAYAKNFLTLSAASKAEATTTLNRWLAERLVGLRQQVEQTDAAVQQFRISNGLLSASGVPLNEQEISTYNLQTGAARAALAEDQARLNTALAQLARGSSGDDLGEALNSPVIQALRLQRQQISSRLAGLEVTFTSAYPEVQQEQQRLADVDRQIAGEIKRIVSNLQAKVQVSQKRLDAVQGTLSTAKGTLAANNQAAVRLNELQRNADAARAVYESFLNRFKETSAMVGMVEPDARLLALAERPTGPSSPNVKLNLATGMLVALMAGLAGVAAAEILASGLTTGEDIEQRVGAAYVGSVPLLNRRSRTSPGAYLTSKPMSAFAEALRGVRASLLETSDGDAPHIIAITSSLPGEGKTHTAVSFASSFAMQGYKTILVDCDSRRPSLCRYIPPVDVGLLEVLEGRCTLQDAVVRDDKTGAFFLPLAQHSKSKHDLFATEAMEELLAQLRLDYDIVILDAPPVLGVADTRTLAPLADAVLLLAQWRKTPRKAVETSLKMLLRSGARVAGIALTQVDLKQQSRSGYGDPGYYYGKYAGYYVE
ncbi:GumC family protein [Phenylobacterium deserti]|uniref:non-specific protein-tyrosine kinase n=1 Tax=Phenylobacterium deserti TaxID=1914756 RepID=A0A328ASS6_9CAUL|nr:polysaccharide biosynthesis tyrosine autokinase [Phenylobacterium deserti]RAK58142.1 capsular biosynthesis protein [Phenylobacterium deserti]